MLKSFLKRGSRPDAVIVPEELQKLGRYLLDFHRYPTDPIHAVDVRVVVDNLEPFRDINPQCWELFLSEYNYSAMIGLYNMFLNVVVPLDGVEIEELISAFLGWMVFLTKRLPAEGYRNISIEMRLLSNASDILRAYPNERIASLISKLLELIAKHEGPRIDASINKSGLENCLKTILECFDSIYLRDSHILVQLTVLVNNLIVNGTILDFMTTCPNLDKYRDSFCRYWNLGNSVQFYIPVIDSIFSSTEAFFTKDDAKIIVNTLLNTLESSQDSFVNNLLINCLQRITSEAKFRELGEAAAKRALFVVNNVVEWAEPSPEIPEKAGTPESAARRSSASSDYITSVPMPSSARRASLQAIQFQLACIADT